MLVIINAAIFFAQVVLDRFAPYPVERWFALSVEGLGQGYVWQLLSYQFMHANLLHLVFNCWAIYVFGQEVEEALGRKSFLTLYLASGVIGGLTQALTGLVFGGVFAEPVVGASAAAFGLAAAFATLFPDRVLLLFFIIPMRAKYLIPLGAALGAYGIIAQRDSIAHAAHLGGLATGWVYVRYASRWTWPEFSFRRRGRRPPRLVAVPTTPASEWRRKIPEVEDLPRDEFVSKEVDPILDKISAHGIQSLTEQEKRILQSARDRMSKR